MFGININLFYIFETYFDKVKYIMCIKIFTRHLKTINLKFLNFFVEQM